MTYRFGPFLADRTTYSVFEGGRSLTLTPKLLDLLFYLLERPATLVTKEELLDAVWPDANVTDNALAQAISELRDALGDAASAPTFIRTVARRGYRFIAPVDSAVQPRTQARAGASEAGDIGHDGHAAGLDTVAVLDFTNVTGDADVAWLAAGIAETVTSDLAALGHFRVIDRWRVVQAVRRAGTSIHDVAAALNVDRIVTGSYQRIGPNLRITAHMVDLARGEAVADAKVDGLLQDVFGLQDGIVTTFARELGVPTAAGTRRAGRETSSLEAYRAYTEGWLKVESLDTNLVSASIADFERAIRLDPAYALAHTGLANAAFVAYEMTRANLQPDMTALAAGIEHARRAIRLDPGLAEAHATLSFLLVSAGHFDDARSAAQQAVAIEPDSWRHQYRLGHASWGTPRLRAMERAIALYPQFSYAHFEMTMVHVARGELGLAEDLGRQGVADQDRQAHSGNRFPAIGFHWLLGALAAARGRHREAIAEFERELQLVDPRRLYGPEYGALTLIGKGHGELAVDDPSGALRSFREALSYVPGHPRALIGEGLALRSLGDESSALAALEAAGSARRRLAETGRQHEALYAAACHASATGDHAAALDSLTSLLALAPSSFNGWTVPVEPCFSDLADSPRFAQVLERLAEGAK
jgi:DNA-binding winged helix-turn-helix (wHTH) protein/tetratricopeptide (TPR) repeat protein